MNKGKCVVGKFILSFLLLPIFMSGLLAQGKYEFVYSENKMSLKSLEGETLIPAQYEKLGWSEGHDFPVAEVIGYYDEGWGLISVKGKKVTANKYYTLQAIHQNLIIASIKGKFSNELLYGAINSKGESVIDFKYHSLKPLGDLLVASERRNGQSFFGLVNQNNRAVLPMEYLNVTQFGSSLFKITDTDQRRGLLNRNGQFKFKPTLDSIGQPIKGQALIYESGQLGLIDSIGTLLVAPTLKAIKQNDHVSFIKHELRTAKNELIQTFSCDSIQTLGKPWVILYRNGFAEVFGKDNKVCFRGSRVKRTQLFRDNLIIQQSRKYFAITANNNLFDDIGFDEIQFDHVFLYGRKGNTWQIYNAYGRKISDLNFDHIIANSTNLIPVKIKNYWGYLDATGELALPLKYDFASPFTNQMAQVSYLGSNMLINQFGEQLGEAAYDCIEIYEDNMAVVYQGSRIDILNHSGSAIFQTYNQLIKCDEGFYEKTEEGKIGFISKVGKIIFHPIYDSICPLYSGKFFVVKNGNQIGLTLHEGSWLIPITNYYEEITGVYDGFIGIRRKGGYGFINFSQQLVIAHRYDSLYDHQNQMAIVKFNSRWGAINDREEIVIQPNYDFIYPFDGQLAIVRRAKKYGVIDPNGQIIIALEFESTKKLDNGNFLVEKDKKFGVLDQTSTTIVPYSYTGIQLTEDGHYILERRGLSGVVNANGDFTIPLKYLKVVETDDHRFYCQLQP